MEMVQRHLKGSAGNRGCDLLQPMLQTLLSAMMNEGRDILGDLFQGAITYGERGQFFTPDGVSHLMAELTAGDDQDEAASDVKMINDPACGSGRMLMDAALHHPKAEVVGQDVDSRCVRMAAINLAMRACYGYVVCMNTLTCEAQFAYRVGSFFHEMEHGPERGLIRRIPLENAPVSVLVEDPDTGRKKPLAYQPLPPGEWRDNVPVIMEVPRAVNRAEIIDVGSKLEELESQVETPEAGYVTDIPITDVSAQQNHY
jgi:hypothetical protein